MSELRIVREPHLANAVRRSGEPQTITACLEADHRRLDALAANAAALVEAGNFARAARDFAELTGGLKRHIEVEETILFPIFERVTGITAGPTLVMQAEHREIRRYLDLLSSAFERADSRGYAESFRNLEGVLASHNRKEERILYPLTDRAIADDGERAEIVERVRAAL